MPRIIIRQWHGGRSDFDDRGVTGSFIDSQSMDIRARGGVLQAQLALEKVSASSITKLARWISIRSDTERYYLSDAGGTCILTKDDGSYTDLHTDSAGAPRACGMDIFKTTSGTIGGKTGTMVFFSADKTSLSVYGDLEGTPAVTAGWQTLTSAEYHPMLAHLGVLFVGNGSNLASVDRTSTWNSAALALPPDMEIRAIAPAGDFVAVAANGNNRARVFLWDGTSASYNREIPVEESIQAMTTINNVIYVVCGSKGSIYALGDSAQLLRVIGNDIGLTEKVAVMPGGVCSFRGMLAIAVSGQSGETSLKRGIWMYGTLSPLMAPSLTREYVISTGSTDDGVTMGGIAARSTATSIGIRVGWNDDSAYGIDANSNTNRPASSVYDSLILDAGDPTVLKQWKFFAVRTKPLPSGATINVYYKADYATSWTQVSSTAGNAANATLQEYLPTAAIQAKTLQIRVEIALTTTTANPQITAVEAYYDVTRPKVVTNDDTILEF